MHLPTVKRYLGQGFSMWNVTSATVNHKLVAEYDLIDVTVVMFYVTDLTFHVMETCPCNISSYSSKVPVIFCG